MKKLSALVPVLEMIADRERQKMRHVQEWEQELRTKFKALEGAAHPPDFSPAGLSGAHLVHEIWSQRARERLNLDLAAVLAQKEDARIATGRAVGRLEVLRKICQRR